MKEFNKDNSNSPEVLCFLKKTIKSDTEKVKYIIT